MKKCKFCGTVDNLKTDKLGRVYNYCVECSSKEYKRRNCSPIKNMSEEEISEWKQNIANTLSDTLNKRTDEEVDIWRNKYSKSRKEFDTPEWRKKISDTLKNKSPKEVERIKKRRCKTNIIKYGAATPLLNKDVQTKRYNTMKKNNSFNTSKPAELIYEWLNDRYTVVREYKEERYPFACDYYIPSLDLFIEYHGHFTHGKEPFDMNNDNHIKLLNKYKSKDDGHNLYNKAIYVWTDLDIRKKVLLEELNHIILYEIPTKEYLYNLIEFKR